MPLDPPVTSATLPLIENSCVSPPRLSCMSCGFVSSLITPLSTHGQEGGQPLALLRSNGAGTLCGCGAGPERVRRTGGKDGSVGGISQGKGDAQHRADAARTLRPADRSQHSVLRAMRRRRRRSTTST